MKPILFNTEMARAILAGRKTVTRRLVKPQPAFRHGETGTPEPMDDGSWEFKIDQYSCIYDFNIKPPCYPGDVLYVRETWCDPSDTGWPIVYKADLPMHWNADETEHGEAVDLRVQDFKWRPSIHMPAWAARIFLRVKQVRVERLNAMQEEDAIAEGFPDLGVDADSPLERFATLWDKTIDKQQRDTYGWWANPWVWVIEFEQISKEDT